MNSRFKAIYFNLVLMMFSVAANANETIVSNLADKSAQAGVITYKSNYSAKQTLERLIVQLEQKKFTIFNQIHHSEAAKKLNIELKPITLVIFGNPKIGSRLMQCEAQIALDLPQKALIWQDQQDQVWLSINHPKYLQMRHQVKGCDQLFVKVSMVLNGLMKKVTN